MPAKANHTDQHQPAEWLIATLGARTARGGRISQVTSDARVQGHQLARVGDTVSYDYGTHATIIDGAGLGAFWDDKPFALVGSHLDNGDTITETLQTSFGIVQRERPIPGLFDPSYVLPQDDEPASDEGHHHG